MNQLSALFAVLGKRD